MVKSEYYTSTKSEYYTFYYGSYCFIIYTNYISNDCQNMIDSMVFETGRTSF